MHLLHALSPVLLTGVTGLIGGELLRAILNARLRSVTTIVRPGEGSNVESRVADRLRRSGWKGDIRDTGLQVVPGDLRNADLGLSAEAARAIRREVQIIIHAAAETSFLRSRDCHEINIVGMQHLLEFARTCERQPLIVYFSTAANSGAVMHRCLNEEEGCQPDSPHHNEYTRSKALAEKMLWDSGLPALVLRPSIVFSAGLSDPEFARAILWFVPLLNEFEAIPIDPASRFDAVPVSFVVESTMALLQKGDLKHSCYHLSAGPEAAERCGKIGEFLDAFYKRRKSLRFLAHSEWTRQVHRQYVQTREQRKIFLTLKPYLPFLNMDVVYDNTRLISEIGEHAAHVPPFTSYLGQLLPLIDRESAMAESFNP